MRHITKKELKELGDARKRAGLPALKEGMRKCLCCDSEFLSYNIISHRLCGNCKHHKTSLTGNSIYIMGPDYKT